GILILPEPLRNPRRVYANLIDARPRRDIESLAIGVAKFDVGGELGRENRAQVLARRRNNPDSSGRRLVEISLLSTLMPSVMPGVVSSLMSMNIMPLARVPSGWTS